MLDNEPLIRTHIHALVLETLAHKAGNADSVKLSAQPVHLLDIDTQGHPFFADFRRNMEAAVLARTKDIVTAVQTAFAQEVQDYGWFNESLVKRAVPQFFNLLDLAFAC